VERKSKFTLIKNVPNKNANMIAGATLKQNIPEVISVESV
jgi:hypothetical protein